jgi:hypothetical protein
MDTGVVRTWRYEMPTLRLVYSLPGLIVLIAISLPLTACTDSGVSVPPQETPTPTVAETGAATPTPAPTPTRTPSSGGSVHSPKGFLILEPERGDCGRYITVQGNGFQAGATIGLALLIGAQPGFTSVRITVPADGVFLQKVPLLRHPECRDGEHVRIIARDLRTPRTGEELALLRMPDPEAVYTVANPSTPTFMLSATTGPCDATIELTGTGLAEHTEKIVVGLMRHATDSPSVILGTVEIGSNREFRLPIRLGTDGCATARAFPVSPDLYPFVVVVFDATESPLLGIGGVRYTPTTGEPSPEGGAHRNPAWTEPTCCI